MHTDYPSAPISRNFSAFSAVLSDFHLLYGTHISEHVSGLYWRNTLKEPLFLCSHYLKCIIPVTATSQLLKKRQENRGKFLYVSEKLKKPGGMTKSLSGTENTAAIAARLLRVICNVTFHKFISHAWHSMSFKETTRSDEFHLILTCLIVS